MHCLGCRYDLTGNVSNRCPECGRAFDPADPETVGPRVNSPPRTCLPSLKPGPSGVR